MKTNEFPIEVAGVRVHLDATFSGEPAMYRMLPDGKYQHYTGGHVHQSRSGLLAGLKPGDVVIFGSLVE